MTAIQKLRRSLVVEVTFPDAGEMLEFSTDDVTWTPVVPGRAYKIPATLPLRGPLAGIGIGVRLAQFESAQ